MERIDGALPLTRAQLDIWLAQETSHSGTEWQLGVLVRFDGTVERELLERAIRQVMREAEPARAAIFEMDGQVFQRAIDDAHVEVAFYDLSDSPHPMQEAREMAAAIQRTPMPLTGPLFKFALFQTRSDEFCFFGCCHHIVLDGSGIALVGHRIASVYSAAVSGAPISTALFGSLADLIECELEYEASDSIGAYVSLQPVGRRKLTLRVHRMYFTFAARKISGHPHLHGQRNRGESEDWRQGVRMALPHT